MTTSKRYNYSCFTCQGSVKKEECGKKGERGSYHGLHGWSCSNCGDGVKVARQIRGE